MYLLLRLHAWELANGMADKLLSVSSHRGSGFVKELRYAFVTLHAPEVESQMHGYYQGSLYNAWLLSRLTL